jgi:hypothetical protein
MAGQDDAQEREKAYVEGIQSIIKAKQEGYNDMQQSVQQSHQTRTMAAYAHSQSIRDTGRQEDDQQEQQQKKEKYTPSRETQGSS